MSNIDKQWLQQKIADMEEHRDLFPGDLDDDHGSVLAALRIALASLEAEPSYFVNRVKHSDAYGEDVELRTYCYELDALKSKDDFGGEIVPVYTAPPAPFALPVQHWEDLCRQNPDMSIGDAIIRASWWNHCAAMLQGAEKAESTTTMQTAPALDSSPKIAESTSGNSPVVPDCSCGTCRPVTFTDSRFVVCSECGNKRCPHANDHRNACTGSNEPGQEGSAYPAAPQQDTSRELFVSVEGDSCSKHPDTQLINHPHRQTASIPPHPVKYCPKCEPGVLPLRAFRIPDEWIFGAHTNCLTISCSVKSDKKITFVNSSFVNCSEPEGDIQFINCTLPAEWEGKVNAIDCVFKAAPQQEVK